MEDWKHWRRRMALNELDPIYKTIDKLDTAIDKLADVSGDIKQILAVHENRLDQTETIMERHFVQMDAVHNRVSNLRDDMNDSEQKVYEKINEIEKWKWQVIGGSAAVAMVISAMVALMEFLQFHQ